MYICVIALVNLATVIMKLQNYETLPSAVNLSAYAINDHSHTRVTIVILFNLLMLLNRLENSNGKPIVLLMLIPRYRPQWCFSLYWCISLDVYLH